MIDKDYIGDNLTTFKRLCKNFYFQQFSFFRGSLKFTHQKKNFFQNFFYLYKIDIHGVYV